MKPEISMVPISSSTEYPAAVAQVLDGAGAVSALAGFSRIIVKPNLVNGSPPPVTTDVRCVLAVVAYLKERIDGEVIVAEGSGEGNTLDNFCTNGYEEITRELGVKLVDLDCLAVKKHENSAAGELRSVHLPRILEGAALVSVPAAKDHTITTVTLGLKNMVGCLPARYYGGYWAYKKSRIHALNEHQAVADLMLYLRPHLTLVDARQGLVGGHLSGKVTKLGKIVAGTDVLAVDRTAAQLLGHEPEKVRHLALAEKFR